jgi:serine/threonine protein kinase
MVGASNPATGTKGGGQIYILDFGIGCLLAETEGESLVDTMSTANSVNSGLDCASPESIMDPTNLTPIGDQYSLGCCLYHFLTGRYPFPDDQWFYERTLRLSRTKENPRKYLLRSRDSALRCAHERGERRYAPQISCACAENQPLRVQQSASRSTDARAWSRRRRVAAPAVREAAQSLLEPERVPSDAQGGRHWIGWSRSSARYRTRDRQTPASATKRTLGQIPE